MISALIAWGIGFGGVNYLPTHGLSIGAVVAIPFRQSVVGPGASPVIQGSASISVVGANRKPDVEGP